MWSLSKAAITIKFTHTGFNQDDDILRSRRIELDFYRIFDEDVSADDLIVKDALLECPMEREPPHPTQSEFTYLATVGRKSDLLHS